MPTNTYFSECPPFPSDVPVANIPSISLRGLENSSEQESMKLWEACRHHGFFQLDLHDSEQDRAVLDEYAYNPPKDLLGYKAPGLLKTDDGKLDATEMYTLGQDDILGTSSSPRRNPPPIESHRSECQTFFSHAHTAVRVILFHLDKQLGLPPGTLSALSPLNKPSKTSLRLLLTRSHPSVLEAAGKPRRVTLGGHIDIGTITLLFHVAGGLQILPAGHENVDASWRFIRPKPGCALINLGDTLVTWTGGLVRSSLHRVVTAPGEQRTTTRRSLAYLIRRAREATMRRLRGEGCIIPTPAEGEDDTRLADEWAVERAGQITRGELKQQTTGGTSVMAK